MTGDSPLDRVVVVVTAELRRAASSAVVGMSVTEPDAIRELVASGGGYAALVIDTTLDIAALACREQLFAPGGAMFCDLSSLVARFVGNGQLPDGAIDTAVDVLTFVAATAGGWRPPIQPLLDRWRDSGWLPQVAWFSALVALRWSADVLRQPASGVLERALRAYTAP